MAIGIEGICICIIANSIVIGIKPFVGIVGKSILSINNTIAISIVDVGVDLLFCRFCIRFCICFCLTGSIFSICFVTRLRCLCLLA